MRGDAVLSLAQIHADRAVPDMTVFELALASAITRRMGAESDEEIVQLLEGWFMRPVRIPDALAALERMREKGWISHDGTLMGARLTDAGVEAVTHLYGGCIRMMDRGLGLLRVATLLSLFDGFKPEDPS